MSRRQDVPSKKQNENLVDDNHGGSENKGEQILATNAAMGR